MDAILVLMQVGREGDWHDRGLPEVVTGYDGADAHAAGLDWLAENHPDEGEDWRVLVWTGVRERPYDRDAPAAVVTPADYRAALAERGFGRAPARRRPRRPWRVSAPAGAVVHKTAAGHVELGTPILITQDRDNTTADAAPGPWFPAREAGGDVVVARVTGTATTTRRDDEVITLMTPVGDLDMLAPNQPIIPVHDER